MIEKTFGEFICDSCGKQTPVSFVIYNSAGFRINTLDLCRDCSNKFAEDIIDSLKKKNLSKQKTIEQQAKTKRTLKKKIIQMNHKSHNHKVVITQLHRSITNETSD